MNITLRELSTLDRMLLEHDDKVEIVEDLLEGEFSDFLQGRNDDGTTAEELLDDLSHFNDSKLLLLRLLNESKLKV